MYHRSAILIVAIVSLLLFFSFTPSDRAHASTCGAHDWSICIPTEQGCEGSTWKTESCTPEAPSCPVGQTGTPRCFLDNDLTWKAIDYCGTTVCLTSDRTSPAGSWCNGCSPPSEPPPNCGNGTIDPGEQCDPAAQNNCQYGSCNSNCTCPSPPPPPPCSCTPQCTAPSALSFTAPAAGSQIGIGTTITWNLGSWGLDNNSSACSNNQCSYQGYSGSGTFRLLMGGNNISSRCQGHQGSGDSAYLTTSQCTITSVGVNWPGTTQTFTVRASNLCGNVEASRNYQWRPNLPPFCSEFTTWGGRILGGRYANRPENQFSITVTAGETDQYGNPSSMRFCYKIATEPEPAQWICPVIATNGTSGVFTSSLNQMKAQFVGNPYYDDIDTEGFWTTSNVHDNIVTQNFCNGWNMYQPVGGSCDGGSCLMRFQNRPPDITATTPNNTEAPIIGTADDSDNGPACTDNNPYTYSMTVTDPDGSLDIDRMELSLATVEQTNPATNPDGEKHFPLRVMFARKLTMAGYQEFAQNTFIIRDTTVDSGDLSLLRCRDGNGNIITHIAGGPNDNSGYSPNFTDPNNYLNTRTALVDPNRHVWCYGMSHNWSNGAYTTTTINGTPYHVWYLQSNLTRAADDYRATLLGATGGDWSTGTYVLYQQNGNVAQAHFKVRFDQSSGGTQKWNNTYNNLWMAIDEMGKQDLTVNLPGESILTYPSTSVQHIRGTTQIDLTRPTANLSAVSIENSEILQVPWALLDQHNNPSGLAEYYMEGRLQSGGAVIHPIAQNNNFPAEPPSAAWYNPWPTDVQQGGVSGDFNDSRPEAKFLVNNSISGGVQSQNGVERINIGNNETGSLAFHGYAVDKACNMSNNPSSTVFEDLFRPWMISRAGLVYTESVSNSLEVRTYAAPPRSNLCPVGVPTCTQFSTYPFNFANDHIDVTTEWFGAGSSIPSGIFVNQVRTGLFRTPSYIDNNNPSPTNQRNWFDSLRAAAVKKISRGEDSVNVGTFNGGTLPQQASDIAGCVDNGKPCIVMVGESSNNFPQPLNIVSVAGGSFTCNRPILFFASSLTIDADIVADQKKNGCIFIVQGDVTIQDGVHRSAGQSYPHYDLVSAFIIANGTIRIPEVDDNQPTRDGLKVWGGLLGFGSDGSGRSIVMQRTLRLANNALYPTYVIHHDNRYYEIARQALANDREAIKQEVGFKP